MFHPHVSTQCFNVNNFPVVAERKSLLKARFSFVRDVLVSTRLYATLLQVVKGNPFYIVGEVDFNWELFAGVQAWYCHREWKKTEEFAQWVMIKWSVTEETRWDELQILDIQLLPNGLAFLFIHYRKYRDVLDCCMNYVRNQCVSELQLVRVVEVERIWKSSTSCKSHDIT